MPKERYRVYHLILLNSKRVVQMENKYPATKREIVSDELHGVKIEDPYRWLEDSASEEVQDWVKQQNKLTLSVLKGYAGEESIKKRLHDLHGYDYVMVNYFQVVKTRTGVRFFYYFREAGKNQPSMCYQDGEKGERVVLYNPLSVSEEGLVSVDWFVPSNDGSMIAFGVSEGGTEKSVLHVMNVDTLELLDERIPQTKWCSLVWLNNEGFYYSRYPIPGTVSQEDENYYHHVYYHKLGNNYKEDVKIFGEERAKTEHPDLQISDNCSLLVIASQRFISTDIHVAKINQDSPSSLNFIPIIESDSFVSVPSFNENTLFVITQIDAPNGQILRYDLSNFHEDGVIPKALTVVKESDGVIFEPMYVRFAAFNGQIAVIEDKNASGSLKVYDVKSGELVDNVELGTYVTLYQLVTAPGLDTFYYSYGSFFYPASHFRYQHGKSQLFYRPCLDIDPDLFKSELVWYGSRDGTKVSMFILSKKGESLSNSTPVTITGYGGFGISMTPGYSPDYVAWVENGGVIAVPHLRGGGEYGQKWHRAGNRENKQNVFDDFISAAEWLIENGIGSRDTIAIYGGSNGGLLVGAALVQRPDLFTAVSCHVPLLDMIRYTNFQVAKTWATEYGDPDVKEEFEWIFPYSPYHHVKDTQYPPTLMHTALGDSRVDPMHAFKMTAKLQSKSAPFDENCPIILYTETKAGHGAGSSTEKLIDLWTKSFIFRAHHTGLEIKE
jgi:prolyl oligopeptidase